MATVIVGVMGPGAATPAECAIAERLGERIAENGWTTLTGGRPVGIMEAALRGAKRRNGLTIGILPGETEADASADADIRILTGMGEARNIVNVLSSHVLCVCGMSAGTASEVALALKMQRAAILIDPSPQVAEFWGSFSSPFLHVVATPEAAVELIAQLLRAAAVRRGS